MRCNQILNTTFMLALFHSTSLAGDWTTWGGANNRNMVGLEKNLPDSFNPGRKDNRGNYLPNSGQNIKWIARLGSYTFGTPVISNQKVFIGTNNGKPRDKRIGGDQGVLMCFDEDSGRFLWQLIVPKLKPINDCPKLGISSTPTVEGERLYVVTNRCEVLCLSVHGLAKNKANLGPFKGEALYRKSRRHSRGLKTRSTDADIIWRYDIRNELGVFPHEACNSAILIHGDLLYVGTANGMDGTHKKVAKPNGPTLIALNKRTGRFVARDGATIGKGVYHGQWSSPSLGRVSGKDCIFYGGGDGRVYAFETTPSKNEKGQSVLKVCWSYDGNPSVFHRRTYQHEYGPSEIIATPVFLDGRLYVPIGQDPWHKRGRGFLSCIDPTLSIDKNYPRKYGASAVSTAACPPWPSRTVCSTRRIFPDACSAWKPEPGNSYGCIRCLTACGVHRSSAMERFT